MKTILSLFIGMLLYATAWAGFEEGLAAYTRKDFSTALREFRPLAERGNAQAQTGLGMMYAHGHGVMRDYGEAVRWYRKAADQGNAVAQTNLGVMYRDGHGVTRDDGVAVHWYRKAADQGLAEAQNNLGWMYANGRGVAQDDSEAVRWYRKAADQGNADAQNRLGVMYQGGRGVSQDDSEAVRWYRRAADQGHAWAQKNLGVMYERGLGVAQDDGEAVRWYRKAADQGLANAQTNLGVMYRDGHGVTRDDGVAVHWYRKAADQGLAVAQNNLGWMYANGRGVAQDDSEAVRWYRKAADQGNADAQNRLGVMYQGGRGVSQDDSEAVRWYRRAADQGHAWAQKNLDMMHKQGRGGVAQVKVPDAVPAPPKPSPVAVTPVPPTDTTPPIFSFPGGIRVVIGAGNHVLTAVARDASAVAEVSVDGQPIAVGQDGAFSLKRFFPLGETVLTFKATDIYGNVATQPVTVLREAATPQTVASDEPPLVPPEGRARRNPHAVALIIGIEHYRSAPAAQHAERDAKLFYDYAQGTLGIPEDRIKLLTGAAATRTSLLEAVKTWLAPMVKPGKSPVVVYFAGHGLVSENGEKAYLIPQDGVAALLEDTALDRDRLLEEIAKVKPLSTQLFFDTCYSGSARGGEASLVASSRAIVIKPKASALPPGFVQFSAAGNDQLAHSHPSQPHGLFSYYLMRGLAGEADSDHDKRLTAGELQDFIQERVQRMSLTRGKPQTPQLTGDRDRVITVWGK